MTVEPQHKAAADDMSAAAYAYAARGWRVFPCRGKVPLTAHGCRDASDEAERIKAWWAESPGAGVGVATGEGLVVLDVDGDEGADALHELEREHGELPPTITATTARGAHYYFTTDEEIRNSAGKLAAGLDVRGDGGYVVAPPSPHPSGQRYEWDTPPDEDEAAPLPAWLREQLTAPATNGAGPVGAEVPSGQRNATLASLAGSMRKRGMQADAIGAALKVENTKRCSPPLPAQEVERIAASVGRYEPEGEPEEPFALEVMTARAVADLPDPPRSDELLGPLLQRGTRLVLGGGTGEGKTTLSMAMVRAVVAGETLLDWTGSGGRALVLDAEQGLKTVKRRLREGGLDQSDDVDYVRVPDGLSLDSDPGHIAEVERVLRDGDYSVVLADPLYKLSRGDSNDERAAVDLMRRFDAWREELRFALVLPVHLRKPPPGAKFSLNEFFGSSAYLRGAEVVIGLQRVSDGYARLHFLKDRDGDLPVPAAWGLLFDREQGYRRDPSDGAREPTAADRVGDLLAESAHTADQLAELTGYSERTIRDALRGLGAVSDGRPKVWSMPSDEPPDDLDWT